MDKVVIPANCANWDDSDAVTVMDSRVVTNAADVVAGVLPKLLQIGGAKAQLDRTVNKPLMAAIAKEANLIFQVSLVAKKASFIAMGQSSSS
jgi:hypothetical protein